MGESVEIGMGKSARRAYGLDDVAIVPSRRTRDVDDVSLAWQIDAFRFDLPLMAHPSDATMSPESAVALGRLGGLGVLNAEGLWTRSDDPAKLLHELSDLDLDGSTRRLQAAYAEPVRPELVAERIRTMGALGLTTAVRVSPQRTLELAPVAVDAGVDLLVIQGTIVSAEHVTTAGIPLNLKHFIADLDIPVVVGGCANYQTALHLMRTGAAGVIVGVGTDDQWGTTDEVLGIRVPMATAISDAAAARRDYLDETGGRYVHVVADGGFTTSGAMAKAVACGADAVMLGQPLAACTEAPAGGAWWPTAASHPNLPRGTYVPPGTPPTAELAAVLRGPSDDPFGELNLFGGLRRAMAKTGYSDVKAFQKVELVLDR